MKRGALAAIIASLALSAGSQAQSFNIDLDIGIGDPAGGNGAPSSAFGAAASQPGTWNRVDIVARGPLALAGLDGTMTGVTYSLNSVTLSGGIGFGNPANTGDFALLLNDAAQVGAAGTGGYVSYAFYGLQHGVYDIYTYAVRPFTAELNVPVTVPEAVDNQTQVVSGPMPGNSFEYLVTHSKHRVVVGEGDIVHVDITQPSPLASGYFVNGFQIALVPEPNGVITLFVACALMLAQDRITRNG